MSLVLFVMSSVIRVKDNFFFELVEGEKNFENIPEWAEAKKFTKQYYGKNEVKLHVPLLIL